MSVLENLDKRFKKTFKTVQRAKHRALCVILGQSGSKQVPVLHELLKSCKKRATSGVYGSGKRRDLAVLWSFKETEDIFRGENKEILNVLNDANDPEVLCSSYKDIEKVFHRTFDLAILQDLDTLSMQNLFHIFGAVRQGGVILFLLPNVKDLNELESSNLGICQKLSRFWARFASSLLSGPNILISDDKLEVLSCNISTDTSEAERSNQKAEIRELQEKYEKDVTISTLLGLCKTKEQAEILCQFLKFLQKRDLRSICSVSSAIGRGKSALLGLAIAGALTMKYSNIYVSSMHYKNVETVFRFLLKGLDALQYQEDEHFDLIQSVHPELENALSGVDVFKDHPQSVRFIFPKDIGGRLDQAELVVLDEATEIPDISKMLSGPYVTLMASSTSGLGASSPSLYLNLVKTTRNAFSRTSDSEKFQEFEINEPIHYAKDDSLESWLNRQLCTDPIVLGQVSSFPLPDQCNLFYVNRDNLFSRSDEAERLLKSFISLFSCEGVIDSDTVMQLADEPHHHLFCLLPPGVRPEAIHTEILCVILVHLESEIPDHIVRCGTNMQGPTLSCFNEWKANKLNATSFANVPGIHILKLVTHPRARKLGYGQRALQVLQEFYEGKCISLDEEMDLNCSLKDNDRNKNAILQKLTETKPDDAEYIMISCDLDLSSLKFWKKTGFIPVYISDTVNSKGNFVMFMMKCVAETFQPKLNAFWFQFKSHFCHRLAIAYRNFPSSSALTLMHLNSSEKSKQEKDKELTKDLIDALIKPHEMKILERYCQNVQELYSIIQFIPTLALMYFKNLFKAVELSIVQECILLEFGLQFKSVDEIAANGSNLPKMQIHALLKRSITKIVKHLTDIIEKSVEKTLEKQEVVMQPIEQTIDEELEEAGRAVLEKQKLDALRGIDISQYAIKGSEDDWEKALGSSRKTLVSIKSIKKISKSDKFVHVEKSGKKSKKRKR